MTSACQLVAKAGWTFKRVRIDPDSACSGPSSSGKSSGQDATRNICSIGLDSLSQSSDSMSVWSGRIRSTVSICCRAGGPGWFRGRRGGDFSSNSSASCRLYGVLSTILSDMYIQDRTGQDRTGQDRTGQDSTVRCSTGPDGIHPPHLRPGCGVHVVIGLGSDDWEKRGFAWLGRFEHGMACGCVRKRDVFCSHADPTRVVQGLGHGRNPSARRCMTGAWG